MKTKIAKEIDNSMLLKDATSGKIITHMIYRHRVGLLLNLLVISWTWYIVNYWAVAWQNFQ